MQLCTRIDRTFEKWCKGLQTSADSPSELCRSRKNVKNAPTLAIGGVHTAENEPPKVHKNQEKYPFETVELIDATPSQLDGGSGQLDKGFLPDTESGQT